RDLVQEGVADLGFGVEEREWAREGDDLFAVLAAAEAAFGVVEFETPTGKGVSPHQVKGEEFGIVGVHGSRRGESGGLIFFRQRSLLAAIRTPTAPRMMPAMAIPLPEDWDPSLAACA